MTQEVNRWSLKAPGLSQSRWPHSFIGKNTVSTSLQSGMEESTLQISVGSPARDIQTLSLATACQGNGYHRAKAQSEMAGGRAPSLKWGGTALCNDHINPGWWRKSRFSPSPFHTERLVITSSCTFLGRKITPYSPLQAEQIQDNSCRAAVWRWKALLPQEHHC